jgi:hypothetical protein
MKGKIIIKTHISGGVSIKTRMENVTECEKAILMHILSATLEMSKSDILEYATLETFGVFDEADREAKTKGILACTVN